MISEASASEIRQKEQLTRSELDWLEQEHGLTEYILRTVDGFEDFEIREDEKSKEPDSASKDSNSAIPKTVGTVKSHKKNKSQIMVNLSEG